MQNAENHDLVDRPATELRELIGKRDISPVELLHACMGRIEATNPYINAVTATCFDRALAEARQAESAVMRGEAPGLLHGLPLGIKDLEPTAGLLTTYGSPTYRDNIPTEDVLLVARLRAAGGIVAGKTNVPEYGAGGNTRNPVWGATGNPFNPALNAGGSSGGSAAALALGMLPVCTGSDTGGSLRIPAAKCGVVGFRPSPGVVPSARKILGWSPISVVGPMGRTVDDTCLQLAASAGADASDPLSYPLDARAFLAPAPADLRKLRVAYTADFGTCDVDPVVRKAFQTKIDAMRSMFGACEEVAFDLGDVHRCFDVLRAEAFVAGMHAAYERDAASLGEAPRANYELGAAMNLLDCAWAQAEQTRILKKFQTTFGRYDLLLSPTTPVTPFPWTLPYAVEIDGKPQSNYYRWLALTYVTTLATHPALSLPCGTDAHGMPFGLQIVGRFRGDLAVLSAAKAMEESFAGSVELCRPTPDIARLGPVEPSLRSIVTAPPGAFVRGAGDPVELAEVSVV